MFDRNIGQQVQCTVGDEKAKDDQIDKRGQGYEPQNGSRAGVTFS